MKYLLVISLISLIIFSGCFARGSAELSCCTICINNYNESYGEDCIKQDYSQGDIKRYCANYFYENNMTINSCHLKWSQVK